MAGARSRKQSVSLKPEWASTISELRTRLNQSQTAFGQRLHSSAMVVSRWERGTQEPTAGSYVELGNLAGDPLCWYFWGRAGLRPEDLQRANAKHRGTIGRSRAIKIEAVSAGGGPKKNRNLPILSPFLY